MSRRDLENYISIYLKEFSQKFINNLKGNLYSKHKLKNMYIKGGRLIEDYVKADKILEIQKNNNNMVTLDIDCYMEFEVNNQLKLDNEEDIKLYMQTKSDKIKKLAERAIFNSLVDTIMGRTYVNMNVYYLIFIIKSFGFDVDDSFLTSISLADSKKIFVVNQIINKQGKYLIKVFLNIYKNNKSHRFAFIDLPLGLDINDISPYGNYILKYTPDMYNSIFTNNDKKNNEIEDIVNKFGLIDAYKYRDFFMSNSSLYLYLLSLSYLSYKHIPLSYFGQKYENNPRYYKSEKTKDRLKILLDLFENLDIEDYSRVDHKENEFKYLVESNLFRDENQNQISNISNALEIPSKQVNLNYLFDIEQLPDGRYNLVGSLPDNLVIDVSSDMAALLKNKIIQVFDVRQYNIIQYYSINCGSFSRNLCKYLCSGNNDYLLEVITPKNIGSARKPIVVKNDAYDKIIDRLEPYLIDGEQLTTYAYNDSLKNCFEILNSIDEGELSFYDKLPEEYFVYRGMNNQTYNSDMTTQIPKRLEDLVPGDVIQSSLVLSTSSRFSLAYDFTKSRAKGFTIFKIKLKRRDKVIFMEHIDLSDIYMNEYEILLPQNSNLIVDEVKYYREWQMPREDRIHLRKDSNIKDTTKYLVITCTYEPPDLERVNILNVKPFLNKKPVVKDLPKNNTNTKSNTKTKNKLLGKASPKNNTNTKNTTLKWFSKKGNNPLGKASPKNNTSNWLSKKAKGKNTYSAFGPPIPKKSTYSTFGPSMAKTKKGTYSAFAQPIAKKNTKKNTKKKPLSPQELLKSESNFYKSLSNKQGGFRSNNKNKQPMSVQILAPFPMHYDVDESIEFSEIFSEVQSLVVPNNKTTYSPSHDELVKKVNQYLEKYPDTEQFLELNPEDMGNTEIEEFIEFIEFIDNEFNNKKFNQNRKRSFKLLRNSSKRGKPLSNKKINYRPLIGMNSRYLPNNRSGMIALSAN